jgi:nucleotide-binding universal stress UspA family protein
MTTIVVGLDASSDAVSALAWAALEARARDATLVAVHAYWVPPAYVRDDRSVASIDPELHQQAEDVLDRVLREAGPVLGGLRVERRLRPGRSAPALIREAAAADLLVVGRRGAGGFEGLLLGATAEHCARHAASPVVVVSAAPRPPQGLVVVGVDGSASARRAVAWAVDHATRRGAEVELVAVYEPYDAPGPFGGEFMRLASPASEQRFRRRAEQVAADAVTDAVADAAAPADVEVVSTVRAGHPAEVLIERSEGADLVVVGSRGRGGFSGLLLGSVSRQLLHQATGPIAIVRG